MKKLTILVALVLVVALAVPTYAASFSDVPSDHWAYAAINEIAVAGIIEGYPDGTFKGDRNMTRYELAMVVSRMLDNIEEEREALADDMAANFEEDIEASNESLSTGEAQDVTAIVKSLIEKNMPEEQEIPEDLTDEQAEQVSNLIKALTYEYEEELEDLNADVEAIAGLEADVEDLQAEVAALKEDEPNVTFSGEFCVDYEEVAVDGSGTPYEDPFTEDIDDDDEDDIYEDSVTFEETLGLNMAINNGPLSADVTLVGSTNIFDNSYANEDGHAFDLDDVQATISNDDFVATIGEDQALTMKPYLYDGKVDEDDDDDDDADDDPYYPVNGVIVETMGETYVLSNNTSAEDDHATSATAFAGTQTLSVMDMDFNFGYGVEDGLSSGDGVLGVDTTLEAGGFSVTPTVAFSDKKVEETYFTLNATGDVGPVATEFNYENIDADFDAIAADVSYSKGYDVTGTMSVNIVDLAAYHEDYDGSSPFTELKAEVTEENAYDVAGLDVYGDSTYANYSDVSDATAEEINVYADKDMGDLTLGGAIEYADITWDFEDQYDDSDVYEETDKFDKILTADYVVSEALDVGAELTFDKDNDLAHLYTADYEKGIITAGAEKYFNDPDEDDNTILTASVTPEAYELLSVNLAPYANFGYKLTDADNYTNYALGVDADKSLSANATLTGMVEYADKEFDVDNSGIKMTRELGVEYAITDDVSATADYTHLDFFADAAGESYDAKKATAGVCVSF